MTGKDVERLGAKKIGHALEEAKSEAKGAKGKPKPARRTSARPMKPGRRTGAPTPRSRGCRAGSLHCPLEYLSHEFADLFQAREKAEFAHYLRRDFDYDLNMGRSLRSTQTILTGDSMYTEFMAEVPRSRWSEPFREAIESGPTRELTVRGRRLSWPIDDTGASWVVHHDPPLGWVSSESSDLWHPMPYRIHDDAHRWWSQLQRLVKGKIPKGDWAASWRRAGGSSTTDRRAVISRRMPGL